MTAIPFVHNWFDLVCIALLLVGVYIGRCRGMSDELLDLLKWLAIVIVAGKFCAGPGGALARWMKMTVSIGYVVIYLLIAFGIWTVFGWIRKATGDKLVSKDTFGDLEYPLGMISGAIRVACMLVMTMAMLNAKYISEEDLDSMARMQRENFGAISFPTLGSVQQEVFNGSMIGRYTKWYLNDLLVAATPPYEREPLEVKGAYKAREDLVNQVTEKK